MLRLFKTERYRAGILVLAVALVGLARMVWAGWAPPKEAGDILEQSPAQLLGLKTALLWVDAREEGDYQRGHIPEAVRLTRDDWEMLLGGFFTRYQSEGEKTVAVYCNPGCHSSHEVANRLREMGVVPVYVLRGGYEAWRNFKH